MQEFSSATLLVDDFANHSREGGASERFSEAVESSPEVFLAALRAQAEATPTPRDRKERTALWYHCTAHAGKPISLLPNQHMKSYPELSSRRQAERHSPC